MKKLFPIAVCGGLAVNTLANPLVAAQLELKVEIPRLNVAEYHRPYVAIWLENADRSSVTNLAVWYDLKLKDNEGTKWLKDLRQWWRRLGRDLQMPADGVSSPTRAPGEHIIGFKQPTLGKLPAGEYRLVVEAAREVGGREMLEIPLQWPPRADSKAPPIKVQGQTELGALSLTVKP